MPFNGQLRPVLTLLQLPVLEEPHTWSDGEEQSNRKAVGAKTKKNPPRD